MMNSRKMSAVSANTVKLASEPSRPEANDSIAPTVIWSVIALVSNEYPNSVMLSNHAMRSCNLVFNSGTSSVNVCMLA